MFPKQSGHSGRRSKCVDTELIRLIIRSLVFRHILHPCGGIHAEQLMMPEKNMSQLMQKRKPDTLLKAGLVIVNIPNVAFNRFCAKVNQRIPDAHTETVMA